MTAKVVALNPGSSPATVGEAPHEKNQLVAMIAIYTLLMEAMNQGIKTQGDASQALSDAQKNVNKILGDLNSKMGDLRSQIQDLQNTMDKITPWLTAFTVITIVLGPLLSVGAAFVGVRVGLQAAANAVNALGKFVEIASQFGAGVSESVKGGYQLVQAGCQTELAPVNADIALSNSAQRNYQETNKHVVEQIGEAMTRVSSISQSVAKSQQAQSSGLRQANQEILQGTLRNYK